MRGGSRHVTCSEHDRQYQEGSLTRATSVANLPQKGQPELITEGKGDQQHDTASNVRAHPDYTKKDRPGHHRCNRVPEVVPTADLQRRSGKVQKTNARYGTATSGN